MQSPVVEDDALEVACAATTAVWWDAFLDAGPVGRLAPDREGSTCAEPTMS